MIRGDRPALLRALPNGRYRPEGGEEIFERMVGAIIVDIGSPADGDDIEGGGLIIDYKKDGTAGRLVLAFNDLGAWVESDEFPATPASYQGQCHQGFGAQRRDDALRRALNTPLKPLKKHSGKRDVSGGGRQPAQGSKKASGN